MKAEADIPLLDTSHRKFLQGWYMTVGSWISISRRMEKENTVNQTTRCPTAIRNNKPDMWHGLVPQQEWTWKVGQRWNL